MIFQHLDPPVVPEPSEGDLARVKASAGRRRRRRRQLGAAVSLVLVLGLGGFLLTRSTHPNTKVTVSGQQDATSAVPTAKSEAVAACQADANQVAVALEAYHANHGSYPMPSPADSGHVFATLTSPDSHGDVYLSSTPNNPNNYAITIGRDAQGSWSQVFVAPRDSNGGPVVLPSGTPPYPFGPGAQPNPCLFVGKQDGTSNVATSKSEAVAACQADARSVGVALEAYLAQHGSYPMPSPADSAHAFAILTDSRNRYLSSTPNNPNLYTITIGPDARGRWSQVFVEPRDGKGGAVTVPGGNPPYLFESAKMDPCLYVK